MFTHFKMKIEIMSLFVEPLVFFCLNLDIVNKINIFILFLTLLWLFGYYTSKFSKHCLKRYNSVYREQKQRV